ncbi:SDR family NAD(P)-dependent oxidoreductase [Mesoterricola sediminis]|uniref:Short-chain dehydrogenase n=1 Tax=Mesoterricola sediminis TaxID=2927980 RepID=A0AA48GZW4_9BACT|nr:SDR family oxidoreductase [Mesoterricola sediminis]BDU78685.1 short-chain dehydrogenase [Mesoterricola sediminis]
MAQAAGSILVTGASSGIGAAVALRLSESSPLVLGGRDLPRLERTAAQCRRSHPARSWAYDLQDLAGLPEAVAALAREGPISAFVHCAGSVNPLPLRNVTPDQLLEPLTLHVLAAAEIARLLSLKRINGSSLTSIVLIGSIWGPFAAKGHTAYVVSKAALEGLTRGLAVDLAPRVTVNAVLPGAVDTPMAGRALEDPQVRTRLETDYPLGIGTPEAIAGAVAFLLSRDAGWITGQSLTVDGGRTIHLPLK